MSMLVIVYLPLDMDRMHGNSNPNIQYFSYYNNNFTLVGEVPAAFETLTTLYNL